MVLFTNLVFLKAIIFCFLIFFFYNKYTMVVRENYFFKRYNFIVRLPQLQNFFKFIGKSQFNFFLSHRLCLYFSKVYSKRFICYFLKKQKYLLLQIKMYLIKVKLSRNATKKKKLKRKKRSKFINRCNSNPKSMTKRITKTKKLMIDV